MKYSFLTGILLGFAGVLAAAAGYPWVQHARVPSQTEVVPNGGRAERFVIRLPADRIGGFTAASPDEVAAAVRPGLASPVSIEQFKLRDVDGRVIGLAARHRLVSAGGADIAWLMTIPGRGALMLAEDSAPAEGTAEALERLGLRDGEAFEADVDVALVTGGATFSAGTGEFAGLDVEFTESWHVTGVDAAGRLRGTIELGTLSRGGS